MTFSEYSRTLYNCIGNEMNIPDFVFELIIKMGDFSEDDPIYNMDTSSFNRFYNGTSFFKIAQKINSCININKYKSFLMEKINSDDKKELLIHAFKKFSIKLSSESIIDDLTDIYLDILANNNNETMELEVDNNLLNSKLSDYSHYYEKENTNIKKLQFTFSNKIPLELRSDFEVGIIENNNEIRPVLKPITPDAYSKHPLNFKLKLDKDSVNTDFFKDIKDSQDFVNKVNMENRVIEIGRTSFPIEEYLGDIPNPFPYCDNRHQNIIKVIPDPYVKHFDFKLQIFNRYINLEIPKIRTDLLFIKGNKRIYSNKRYLDDIFDFEFALERKENNVKTNITITIREKYLKDVKANILLLKWSNLILDNNAIIRLFLENTDKLVLESACNGKRNLSVKNNNLLLQTIAYMEKLLFIETYCNVKFEFTHQELVASKSNIDIIYYAFKRKNHKIHYKTIFSLSSIDKQLSSLEEGQYFKNIITGIDYVDLMGRNFQLLDVQIIIDSALVKKVEKNDKKTTITFETNSFDLKMINKKQS